MGIKDVSVEDPPGSGRIFVVSEGRDYRWVREQIEPKLLARDADAIMREPGLIYMNEALYRQWYYYDMWLMPHDRILIDQGGLIFSGEGRDRWY